MIKFGQRRSLGAEFRAVDLADEMLLKRFLVGDGIEEKLPALLVVVAAAVVAAALRHVLAPFLVELGQLVELLLEIVVLLACCSSAGARELLLPAPGWSATPAARCCAVRASAPGGSPGFAATAAPTPAASTGSAFVAFRGQPYAQNGDMFTCWASTKYKKSVFWNVFCCMNIRLVQRFSYDPVLSSPHSSRGWLLAAPPCVAAVGCGLVARAGRPLPSACRHDEQRRAQRICSPNSKRSRTRLRRTRPKLKRKPRN